jgi:hypothetical protein
MDLQNPSTAPERRPDMATMVSRTICAQHNFVATVGRNVQFALDEYECPTCVAIADREYQRARQQREDWAELAAKRGHPSICLCNACAPWEAEYDRMQEEEVARWFLAEIKSPDYCDHQASARYGCDRSRCPHPGCLERQALEDPRFTGEPPF